MERYNKLREQGLARPVEEAVDDALCGDSGSDTTSESESYESDDDDEPEQIPAVGASEDENNVEDEEGGGGEWLWEVVRVFGIMLQIWPRRSHPNRMLLLLLLPNLRANC